MRRDRVAAIGCVKDEMEDGGGGRGSIILLIGFGINRCFVLRFLYLH